jgi:hypothetical protein
MKRERNNMFVSTNNIMMTDLLGRPAFPLVHKPLDSRFLEVSAMVQIILPLRSRHATSDTEVKVALVVISMLIFGIRMKLPICVLVQEDATFNPLLRDARWRTSTSLPLLVDMSRMTRKKMIDHKHKTILRPIVLIIVAVEVVVFRKIGDKKRNGSHSTLSAWIYSALNIRKQVKDFLNSMG